MCVQIHPFLQQSINTALPGSQHLNSSSTAKISNLCLANHIALPYNTTETSQSQRGRSLAGTHSLATPAITSALPGTTCPFITTSHVSVSHVTTLLRTNNSSHGLTHMFTIQPHVHIALCQFITTSQCLSHMLKHYYVHILKYTSPLTTHQSSYAQPLISHILHSLP